MLTIENLSVEFTRYEKGFFRKSKLKVITNLNIQVKKGEVVAVIGASGAGKSLLAHAILGILPKNALVSGRVDFKDEPLTPERKKKLRGKEIALIPQSVNFLDPLQTAGRQVYRAAYLKSRNRRIAREMRNKAFGLYQLADGVQMMYPYQISGGMARRILTASATVSGADLLIADEPTTGLDANAINESLSHLRRLADGGKAVILITHDLPYALKYADKIAVFYQGTTVEIAIPADFVNPENLRHPYTRQLYLSLPQNDFSFPSVSSFFAKTTSNGCAFEPRCIKKLEKCQSETPPKNVINNGEVWCHNVHV